MINLKELKLFLLDMDGTIYLDNDLFDGVTDFLHHIKSIGDRLYTDIACGVNAGITSIFVLSGEGTVDDIKKWNVTPDYIYDNIKTLYEDMH